jgi:hypothetical protein
MVDEWKALLREHLTNAANSQFGAHMVGQDLLSASLRDGMEKTFEQVW